MARVHHRVGIAATPKQIFDCLIYPDKLIGWWASTAESQLEDDGLISLGFAGLTTLNLAIQKLQSPEYLKLKCIGEPEIWKNSSLEFRTELSDKQTYLYLTHTKASTEDDEFLYFNTKWPLFMVSLKEYLEIGTGRPFPADVRIEHA